MIFILKPPLQAMEVIKVVCGIGAPLVQRLLVYDGLESSFRVSVCVGVIFLCRFLFCSSA